MPRKSHYNPERAIHNRVAHVLRAQKRIAAKQAFNRQIEKERAIGVDPIFLNGNYDNRVAASVEWRKTSRAYNEAR